MASLVQSRSTTGTGVLTLDFTSNVVDGNLILVAVSEIANTDTFTVTDSQGNSYTALSQIASATIITLGQVFYAIAEATGPVRVTFTPGTLGLSTGLAIHEVADVSVKDVTTSATGTGSSQSSGSVTTTQAIEFLFGFSIHAGTSFTVSAGAGYTAAETQTLTSGFTIIQFTEYQVVSSIGSYAATSTSSVSKSGADNWAAQIVTFYRAAETFNLTISLSATLTESAEATGIWLTPISLPVTATSEDACTLQIPVALTLPVTATSGDSCILQIPGTLTFPLVAAVPLDGSNKIPAALSFAITGGLGDSVPALTGSLGLDTVAGLLENSSFTPAVASITLALLSGLTTTKSLGQDPLNLQSILALSVTTRTSIQSTTNINAISSAIFLEKLFGPAVDLRAQVGVWFSCIQVKSLRPVTTTDFYLGLITSEHNQRPRFMAMVKADVTPSVDAQDLLALFPSLFDIDTAVGQQLDYLGQWIGQSRNLATPLPGVYFSWDTINLGWDQGAWFGPGDALTGLTVLDDTNYRILLKGVIAANHWDGTVPGAYAIWAIVFALDNFTILIQDNQDMTMTIILMTQVINAVALSLLINGYITVRPAGVLINGYFKPSVAGAPVFAWDVANTNLAGWDTACWAEPITI